MARDTSETVAELIRLNFDRLTPSERRVANALLGNYPVAGLNRVTELARTAEVSSPTVIRIVQKLGFSGYPEFQNQLRSELSAQLSTPITRYEQWAVGAPKGHALNTLAAAVADNLQQSLRLIDHREFDSIAALLSDLDRSVHLIGGRVTRTLAEYLSVYLQSMRPSVLTLPASSSQWPQHLLSMGVGDVLVVIDLRRYERNLLELARLAHDRGAVIVVITDQWMSPISSIAAHTVPVRVEVPSSTDSAIGILFMAEALVATCAEKLWPEAEERVRDLESLFDASGRFGKQPGR